MSQNPTPALARRMANAVRMLAVDAVDAVERAKSGDPGAPMGMADIAEALWNPHLKHNPAHPRWMERDRFVRSNGHGSMPCSNLFDRQPPAYLDAVLAPQLPAAALPAAN